MNRLRVSAVDEKNICSVRCGSSFYKIHGLGADEFPPLPKFKDDKKVSFSQKTFKGMMRPVRKFTKPCIMI